MSYIDQFIDDTQREEGSGQKHVRNWKKRPDHRLDFWLHVGPVGVEPKPPVKIWRHPFPQVKVFVDKDTREAKKQFWSGEWNCLEDDKLLRKQYFRLDRGKGPREIPPRVCPLCLMVEHVRDLVETGKIGWLEPIFHFKGSTDGPEGDRILRAGTMWRLPKELSDEQVAELKRAGIYVKDAWKLGQMAKPNYIMRIVENANPGEGVQILTEGDGPGGKLSDLIRSRMDQYEEAGEPREKGDPLSHPYAIRFTYDESALPATKYDAKYLELVKMTPQIKELLRSEGPDTSNLEEPMNVDTLRGVMETYCVTDKLDWDAIFGPCGARASRSKAEPAKPKAETKRIDEEASSKLTGRGAVKPKLTYDPETEEPCAECGKAFDKEATTCPHCGAEYDAEPPGDDVPAPKKVEAKAATKPAGKKPPPPPPSSSSRLSDDDIPF